MIACLLRIIWYFGRAYARTSIEYAATSMKCTATSMHIGPHFAATSMKSSRNIHTDTGTSISTRMDVEAHSYECRRAVVRIGWPYIRASVRRRSVRPSVRASVHPYGRCPPVRPASRSHPRASVRQSVRPSVRLRLGLPTLNPALEIPVLS